MNETWLKGSTLDEEILPNNSYKIFRRDRSSSLHPPDSNDPLKYRRNDGGVLVAISCSLQLSSKIIKLKYRAEMLAVEIILNDGSKIVVATCYLVGTLGSVNYQDIANTLDTLLRKKVLKKFILMDDFNLRNANWEAYSSTHSTEQSFINEFLLLGLIQCISSLTHVKGTRHITY